MAFSVQEKYQNELDVLWVLQQLIGPFATFNYSHMGWKFADDSEKGRKACTTLRNPGGNNVWAVEVVAGYVWLRALRPTTQYPYGDRYLFKAINIAGAYCAFAATDKESVEFCGAQPVDKRAWLLAIQDALAVPVLPFKAPHVEVLDDYIAYAKFLAEGMCDGS